jgi:hypothetical protein
VQKLSDFVSAIGAGWQVVVAVGGAVTLLTAAVLGTHALFGLPKQVFVHDSTTQSRLRDQTDILQHLSDVHDKMLCIQIADHRRSDWTACIIPPTVSNAPH